MVSDQNSEVGRI